MISATLSALLAITWMGGAYLLHIQKRRGEELERSRDKIQLQEDRMFHFLHELGSAFSESLRMEELHRLIVEAAARILDGHGGALYLANKQTTSLVPAFVSKACPPLVEAPEHVLAQIESTPAALESYLRRHAVAPGEGVIGDVWKRQEGVLLSAGDERLSTLRDTALQTSSAMIVPLTFAGHRLGVLSVANGALGKSFDAADFAIFEAIAEQSSFALYSASVYAEAHEKRRLDQDLLVAQEIQRILLPSCSPVIAGYEICGLNLPASRVSGDYYDYVRVDETHTGIAIADVSGKGVSASLIMAMCRSALRGSAPECGSASEALRRVNRMLYPDIKEDMFISMAYVILDHHSNRLTLCRAGHDAPLHYSALGETVSKINPPGMAVGIDRGDVFDRIANDFSVSLEPNDCLVLYTDGVTEALDGKGFEFGMKNMIQSIQASASGGASAIVARLTDDLRAFIGTCPQNDDITLIVIRKI